MNGNHNHHCKNILDYSWNCMRAEVTVSPTAKDGPFAEAKCAKTYTQCRLTVVAKARYRHFSLKPMYWRGSSPIRALYEAFTSIDCHNHFPDYTTRCNAYSSIPPACADMSHYIRSTLFMLARISVGEYWPDVVELSSELAFPLFTMSTALSAPTDSL